MRQDPAAAKVDQAALGSPLRDQPDSQTANRLTLFLPHAALDWEDVMKAFVYTGPRDVGVQDVPDARIERPTDVLVRITSTNICGSDLHMYEGRTDFEEGRIFGHENLGEVVEVGDAIDKIAVGDMVSAPFNVSCGHC